jgi:hypothetical protein
MTPQSEFYSKGGYTTEVPAYDLSTGSESILYNTILEAQDVTGSVVFQSVLSSGGAWPSNTVLRVISLGNGFSNFPNPGTA